MSNCVQALLLLFLTQQVLTITYTSSTAALIAGTNSQNVTITNVEDVTTQHKNLSQSMWLVNISIGQPAQNFSVQVDTGSNMLWVPLSTCYYCQMTDRYNQLSSNSYAPTGQTFEQQYGEGEFSGQVAYETVGIIGTMISTNFEMAFATQESGFAPVPGFGGIMGLSNMQGYTNIFQAAQTAGEINSSIFGLVLQPLPLISYLLYGDIDANLLNQVVWIPSIDTERWRLQLETIAYNGVQVPLGNITNGILDSGTSCLVLETSLYNTLIINYISKLCNNSTGVWLCPCHPSSKNIQYLPTISLGLQGVTVNVPFTNYMVEYNLAPIGAQCELCLEPISSSQANFMLFGDPVFESIVAIFNKQSNMVGIATP